MSKVKTNRFFALCVFFCTVLTSIIYLYLPNPSTEAVEELKSEPKTRTIQGINFSVPEDWPITDQGGALAPIRVEEYVTLKFGKVDQHFQALEETVKSLSKENSELKEKLKQVEGTAMDLEARLIDLEQWLKLGRARKI